MIIDESNYLEHYGILRKSGRYPWGSGGDVSERSYGFLDFVEDIKRRLGWNDQKVAEYISSQDPDGLKFSTKDLRQARTIAKDAIKNDQIAQVQRLKDKGWSNTAIGERMGLNESSVRALQEPGAIERAKVLQATADALKAQVAEKKYLDVGKGTENFMGVSKEKKDAAIAMLKEEGYNIHYVKVPQLGTNKDTTQQVLVPPGVTYPETYANRGLIRTVTSFSEDGGRSYLGIHDPIAVDPSRIAIRYAEDGGTKADGVIYVRPGVEDLSLGGSRYAQVRIRVGEEHYLKGMAIYKDDLPDGVDLLFNTNKSDTGNNLDAMKPLKRDLEGNIDPDNPFGASIKRQLVERDAAGNERLTSAMNIVNEEGNWGGGSVNLKTGDVDDGWSNAIASQVLSKQRPELIKNQLGMMYDNKKQEFDEIMGLTNPTVRKKLLEEFAEGTDSSAVHLQAARLPRQAWRVILPIDSLKDNEVYAPHLNNGERVALIRYPHGGTFEIPDLVVNNRHAESRRILGTNPKDAIGINSKVAEHLSGADFDGDTVLVIPNNSGRISTKKPLQGLKNFEPKIEYRPYDGMKTVDGGIYNEATRSVDYSIRGGKPNTSRMQREMGDISNLITDMTIQRASDDQIARAVRHSMVVIDSEKHHLDYRRSYEQNGIKALKEEYQGVHGRSGAATLISRAKSPAPGGEVVLRKASEGGPVDPLTGKKVYVPTGRTYINKAGKEVAIRNKLTLLGTTDDANTLSTGTRVESIYADHSNKLKDLANTARREALNTPRIIRLPSATRTYSQQVASLKAKLDLVQRNAVLERQAQTLANATVRMKRQANPSMDEDTYRKIKFQALAESRRRTNAQGTRVEISPDEWEAIQAGAVSDTMLGNILRKADMDVVRQFATPRVRSSMSTAKAQRAQDMVELGYTQAEIAEQLGVSTTLLSTTLAELNK